MRRIVSIAVILAILASSAAFYWQGTKSTVAQASDQYVVNTFVDDGGQQIDEIIVPGSLLKSSPNQQ